MILRAAFVALSAILVFGLSLHREWTQSFWILNGWERFVLAMSLTAVAALALPRAVFYLGIAILALQVGILPCVGLGLALLGAWNLGWLLFRNEDDRLNLLGGFAIYTWFFSLTASLPIHSVWLWGVLLIAPVALGRRWQFPLPVPSVPIALPLVAYFLLALKPEASADGMSQHLAVIQWVRDFGRFHFDAANQIWAVQPMGGDWAYTIPALFGGEYAARLLNVVWLLLITSFVFSALRRRLQHHEAAVATGLFLATPLLQMTTTSLFVENFWTALVCGALFAIETDTLILAAALLGAAAGTKLLGFFPAIGLAGYAAYRLNRKYKTAALAVALYLAIACVPYVRAYLLTGNPLFHYANAIFKSPFISSTENFVDFRFPARLNWHTLYDLTFRTNLFVEGEPGTAGYQWLLLIPLVVLSLRKLNPFERAAAATAFFTMGLVFSQQAYVRYVIVSLALVMMAAGPCIRDLLADARPTVTILSLALFALNLHGMAGAGYLHRDFCFRLFSWRERERYLERNAPQRLLIADVNRVAPGVPVALLEGDAVAGLRGPAWTASWHTPKFSRRLDQAHSVAQFYSLMRDFEIQYVIAPGPNHGRMRSQNPLRTFLEEATEPISRRGALQLARLKPDFNAAQMQPSGPGEYDDFNTRIQYEGDWIFDDQFPQAANHSLSYSPDLGASAHFDFIGDRLTYVFTKAPNRARGTIEIDGVAKGTFNFMSPKIEWRQRMVFDKLGPGVHRFVLRNAGPNGLHVDIDELIVGGDSLLTNSAK